jgi:hypothetical protein
VGVLGLGKLCTGVNRVLLEDACRLLHDEASGTSGFVEQQHGSISAVHLKHPDLSTRMASMRSYVHMCRTLFHDPPELRPEKRLFDRIDRIQRRLQHAVMGRNAFFKELLATTQEANPNRSQLQGPVMAQHGRLYKSLSISAKRKYETVASELTRVRDKALRDDLEHARSALALFTERRRRERTDTGMTNATREVRFSDEDFESIDGCIGAGAFTPNRIESALSNALEPPRLLSPLEASSFDSANTPAEPGEHTESGPPWVKILCRNRSCFANVVLASTKLSEVGKAYKLLYAMQSPMNATFIPLRLREDEIGQDLEDGEDIRARFLFDFSFDLADYIAETSVPFDADGEDIVVLPTATFIGEQRIATDFPPVAWEAFVAEFPDYATDTTI